MHLFLRLFCSLLFTLLALPHPVFAQNYEVLKRFDGPASPFSRLLLGPDGNYYGTTQAGGGGASGSVYKMTPAGVVTTLAHFNYTNGASPYAGLCLGFDGALYGTTRSGGTMGKGTVYRVSLDGVITRLYSFSGPDGDKPEATLLLGGEAANDGFFYGTTYSGGANNLGTVFKITPAGVLTTLFHFNGGANGSNPTSALIRGTKSNNIGFLYGTTYNGGASEKGTFFKMNTGGALTTLFSFTGISPVGSNPTGELLEGGEGNFYGVTRAGGSGNGGFGFGTVYNITPSGSYTTFHAFNFSDGSSPSAGLTRGNDGNFYGPAYSGGPSGSNGTIFQMTPQGAVAVIASMTEARGRQPLGGLTLDAEGNLLGTTLVSPGAFGSGEGSIFRVSTNRDFTTLHNFLGPRDGAGFSPSLTADASGTTFYGVTSGGGLAFPSPGNSIRAGTIFKITNGGAYTKLFDFDGTANGSGPQTSLTAASDGKLYGTTYSGGSDNNGTLFSLSDGVSFAKIRDFVSSTNGTGSSESLTIGPDGRIYGVASFGGLNGVGTIYRVESNGTFLKLFDFNNAGNGAYPRALTVGPDGNFYGATSSGGASNSGVIFRFTTGGTFTKILDLTAATGSSPSSFTVGSDGNLYGTTSKGGANSVGSFHRLGTNGSFVKLLDFNTANGASPGRLVSDGTGGFYGVTSAGGTAGFGTIFRITTAGALTTLHNFTVTGGGETGGQPFAPPVVGADGKLYGTANYVIYRFTPPTVTPPPPPPPPPSTPKFRITLKAAPGSRGKVVGGGNLKKNTFCTAKATAKAGSVFQFWKEGAKKVSTQRNYKFKVTKARTLTAVFKAK